MKKVALKVVVTTIVMSAVFASGVYAGSTLEQISAYLNKGVTLTWNGQAFYPQEDDGSRVYPITYNGRTYLPVKFVAEKAGLNVDWDEVTSTVSLTDENYAASVVMQGTYTKVGNGEIVIIKSDFSSFPEKGFNVVEQKATTAYDTHTVKVSWMSGSDLLKSETHKLLVKELKETMPSANWKLVSSTELSGGHFKYIYEHLELPVRLETYSTDTEVVFVGTRTDISGNGSYKTVGSGQISFMTDDFKAFTEMGYDVEETLAVSNSDKHIVKLKSMTTDVLTRRNIHIMDVENNKKELTALGITLISSTDLGNGHIKNVYKYFDQPLNIEVYSTDEAVVLVAYRTDMGGNSQTVSSTNGYEGYFTSVPKPSLDSTWVEETTIPLKEWTVGNETAYTLYKSFSTPERSKIAPKFEEYKNTLVNNGFTFYNVSYDHYTYIKGDISIKLFAGYDSIDVNLASGYQAEHL